MGSARVGLAFSDGVGPSERYYQGKHRQSKTLTEWARQMMLRVRRWLPQRLLVIVADSSFAAIELLTSVQKLTQPICMIARFRLDAALYQPAPKRKPGQKGRTRKKDARLPTLERVLENPKTA